MTSTVGPDVSDGTDPRDPRDPRGLRSGAPLLDAWLHATGPAGLGATPDAAPMSIPGHKLRTDLTGTVTAGDIPLYAGLAPIKRADTLLAQAASTMSGTPAWWAAAAWPARSLIVPT